MQLPHQVAQVGRLDKTAVSPPAAAGSGTMTATFEVVGEGRLWLVDRVVVTSTSTTTTAAYLFTDQATAAQYLDGSNSGNFDVADNSSPLHIDQTRTLIVVWTGASDGAVGTCRVQGRVELVRH